MKSLNKLCNAGQHQISFGPLSKVGNLSEAVSGLFSHNGGNDCPKYILYKEEYCSGLRKELYLYS